MKIMNLMNRPLMLATSFVEAFSNFDWIAQSLKEPLGYEVKDGIAIIPIHGLLTKRSELWEGTLGYEDIQSSISQALNDEQVNSILLDIDSPGGEVGGLFDLVDFIFEAKNQKPIYAYANDSAFSAAYAIASACSKIFINRTSGVGSVGVIATHVDVSESDKKEGIKYTTIFAGDRKNELNVHEPLSEKAKDSLQVEIDRLYEMFLSTVSRNRDLHVDLIRATQAATYFGKDCLDIGFADQITSNPIFAIKKSMKFGAETPGISMLNERSEEMTDDIKDEKPGEIVAYQRKILEIAQLCKIAHAENKILEFIQNDFSVDEVKEKLLALSKSQEEIFSANYHKGASDKNPLIVAAQKLAKNH